ncbi:MAG: ABC-type transport auxiliary lipoprotein family protein [Azonexus sp.]
MMRRLAALFSCFLLTACFTGGKRGGDTAMAVYDLGPAETVRSPVPRPQPLALEVRMPLWFDTQGINYRLAYAEPARLREYARARWAGPPAQLIQQRLARDLGLVPAGQSRVACLLRLDIDEFSQVFATPASSRAVVQGRLQWLDRSRGRLVERPINIEMAAASHDSPGGVAALSAAVTELTRQIQFWENEWLASGQLKSCQP